MKLKLTALLVLMNLCFSKAQEPGGTWISYDNYFEDRNLEDSSFVGGSSIGSGFLIDFDEEKMGYISNDTLIPIHINFKESTISNKTDASLSVNYNFKSKDSIEINFGDKMIDLFKPLDLSLELNYSTEQIEDYLLNNDFEKFGDMLSLEFSSDIYHEDLNDNVMKKRNTLINNTWGYEGYWYLRKMHDNYFLILNFDGMMPLKVFQITSLEKCKMKLNPVSNLKIFKNSKATALMLKSCP